VEAFLAADAASGDFLEDSAEVYVETLPPVPGARLGPYRVVRELARGGMGTVYLDEGRVTRSGDHRPRAPRERGVQRLDSAWAGNQA
jgi:hypothetical protein